MLEVRVMSHKSRDCHQLVNMLRSCGIMVRVFTDTSDYYLLDKKDENRMKGAIDNYTRIISDESLPEDNHGFIVVCEDDISIAKEFKAGLVGILDNVRAKTVVSGFAMERYALRSNYMSEWEKAGKPVVYNHNDNYTTQLTILPAQFHKLLEAERKYTKDGYIRERGRLTPYDRMTAIICERYGLTQMCIMPNLVEHEEPRGILNREQARMSADYIYDYPFDKVNWREEFENAYLQKH